MGFSVSLDEQKRRIHVMGEVDESMAHALMVSLDKLEETPGDITIILNSEGGEEASGYALYDAITMCKNMVIIEGYGEVSSIAAAIFQAGDVRRLSSNSIFMIHNGTIPVDPEAQQNAIIDLADKIKKDNRRYHTILSSRSKLSYEDVEEVCSKDAYYTAEEALTAGFCDEIILPEKRYLKPIKSKKGRKKK